MSIEQLSKMYVLVRQDLSPGYQIAQSVHAKDMFAHSFPEIENKWYAESNTIVVLGVGNQCTLKTFARMASKKSLKYSMFFEPDINEYTALAIEPGDKTSELVSQLGTACKGYRKLTS